MIDRKIAPGRRQLLPLPFGVLADYPNDPLGFLTGMVRQHGDVVRAQIGTAVLHLIVHPNDVQRVFQDNVENYPRSWLYYVFNIGVGQGMLNTKGETWRQQRATSDPAFTSPRLAGFAPLATEATAAMLQRWQPLAERGQPANMTSEMMRLALEFISRVVLGVDLSGEGDERGQAVIDMQQYMSDRLVSRWPSVEKFPTPGNRRLHRARRLLHDLINSLIAERRRNPGPPTNVLSMLLTARDPKTGQQLNDQQLLDNVMAFFMAGHETLAYPLAWAWYHLSHNPAVRQQLHEEATKVLGGRPPTFQDLPQLPFARMVVQEALRMYPSVWLFTRQAERDDELGGFFIPARSIIVLCPFLTHRHATFWPNPDKFDPMRFTPERSAGRPPFAYVPFAGGAHHCIGRELAMMGLTLMVSMIAQSYLPQMVDDASIEPAIGVTVRPGRPMMMTLRKVDQHSLNLTDAPKEQRAPA